jgi:hypothetical protein
MSGMKASTIKLVLNKKINNWLASIEDRPLLVERLKKDTIVSGGAIASMMLGEKVNDYDIYFRTFETAKAVAEYYVEQFNKNVGELAMKSGVLASCNPEVKIDKITNIKGKEEERIVFYMKSSGIAGESQTMYEYFESAPETASDLFMDSLDPNPTDPLETAEQLAEKLKVSKKKYRPVFITDNAVTLSDKVQLIVRFYGQPYQILRNYDFAHSMCYYDYAEHSLVFDQKALECMLSKTLLYKGSLYPIASVFRTRKFIERGWRITAGQMLKIIWQISEINLKDPAVLKEQLIGVDQAYMHQLIAALQNVEGKVDSTYIAKLVDEIFE